MDDEVLMDDQSFILDSKKSLPNKLLQEDGTITDITGKPVSDAIDAYNGKPSLPNKFLNPDGTYSTLNEIILETIDTQIFVVVDELPASGDPNKIYLVPDGDEIIEYHWTGTKWDVIGAIPVDLSQYSTTAEVQQMISTYVTSNTLTKTNTTAFTPTANYHPATKKYVDDNALAFKAFPDSFVTDGSTNTFLNSIEHSELPVGSAYLGQVSLSNMPTGVTTQAEVEVYIYPQNVAYCVMRSAEVSPYQWECNSYERRGWEAIDKTAKDYSDNNFLRKDNSTAFTPTGNYNPATKKYVDDAIATNVTNALGGTY